MNNIIDIDTYQPQSADRFFFDANIWMYLYFPIGNYNHIIKNKYGAFFKKVIQSKSDIFISSLMLSEIINRYTRMEFEILSSKDSQKYSNYKKDFRNTQEYDDSINVISSIINSQILKIASKVDDKFEQSDVGKLLKNDARFDFNDRYFEYISNSEDYKIVTHDSDFSSCDNNITILTANLNLLKK